MTMAVQIAVVGGSDATAAVVATAEAIGAALASAGATLVCGGLGGVMAAASRGAADAGGTVVGILPGEDRDHANPWVSIALPTGLGELRNGLIVRAADVAIAVGGAYGTLSEIALAMVGEVPVIGIDSWDVEGVQVVGSPQEAVRRALALAAGGGARDRS